MQLSKSRLFIITIIHERLSPQPQRRVLNRNILRGHLVALTGTGNRADTKVSEPVEPDFFLSQCQISKIVECHTILCSFSCNCESNLKPDSIFHGRNLLFPGARVVNILLFWWLGRKLDTYSWSFRVRTLRKHAYIQICWKIHHQKLKVYRSNSNIFQTSAQNTDYGYPLEPPHRGRSNEYPQSMFLSRNKKNNSYPCKPQFYYIKVGFKGDMFSWWWFPPSP